MIKNLIKSDKRYCFNTIKKIKSEFDQLTRIVFHKRFVKKIMNKTDHNNISILNNNRNNILSELCEKYGSDKGYTKFDKKVFGLGNHMPIQMFMIIF